MWCTPNWCSLLPICIISAGEDVIDDRDGLLACVVGGVVTSFFLLLVIRSSIFILK